MMFLEGHKLDFDDVLIVPQRSILKSRAEVQLDRHYKFRSGQEWDGIPIMTSNMTTVGTIEAAKVLQQYTIITSLHKYIGWEEIEKASLNFNYFSAARIGGSSEIMDSIRFIRLDVANGYREEFVEEVKAIREELSNKIIIAGNVCTPEMTQELLLAGADIVVIGIGNGGQCTTRMKAGVGYPQLSAIIECANAAHGLKGHIVADGGCRTPADVCKAFAAGADFVMLGSMLAAHDENTSQENRFKEMVTIHHGTGHEEMTTREFTHIYGMSSRTALEKHHGGVAKHRTSEGKTTKVYLRGPIGNTVDDILASLRSCCTYVGASSLKELNKRTTFAMVNRQRNTFYDGYTVGD